MVAQGDGPSAPVTSRAVAEGHEARSAVLAYFEGLHTAVRYRVREHHFRVPASPEGPPGSTVAERVRTVLDNGLARLEWETVHALADLIRAHSEPAAAPASGGEPKVEGWILESVVHNLPAERIVLQRERQIWKASQFQLVQVLRTPGVCLTHYVDQGPGGVDQVYASDPERGPLPSVPDPLRILQLMSPAFLSRGPMSEAGWSAVPEAPEDAVLYEVRPATDRRPTMRFLCEGQSLVPLAFAYRDPSVPLEFLIFLTYGNVGQDREGGDSRCWLASVLSVRAGSHPKVELYEIGEVSFDPAEIERTLHLRGPTVLVDQRFEQSTQYASPMSYPQEIREWVSYDSPSDSGTSPAAQATSGSGNRESGDYGSRPLWWILSGCLIVSGLILARGVRS